MTTALLLFVVLCLILGPAAMLLPSRRERREAAFRRRALAAGLRVQLLQIPDPEAALDLSGKPLPSLRPAVAYRLARARPVGWRRHPAPAWKLVRSDRAGAGLPDGWAWQDGAAARPSPEILALLASGLGQMAPDVLSIEEADYEFSVCWREREEQSLSAILELLPRLAALPPPATPGPAEPAPGQLPE